MAVDTRDRRFSMMGLALPLGFPLGNPASGVSETDRLMLLFLYAGSSIVPAVIRKSISLMGRQADLQLTGKQPDLQLSGRQSSPSVVGQL